MSIYVSTCCLKNKNTVQVCEVFIKNKIKNIELSYGNYNKNIVSYLLKKKKISFLLHNYFPSPKKSFVFNLASPNVKIQKKSINLAIKAINISKKVRSSYYSFHAGYLTDPDVSELGGKIKNIKKVNDKNLCLKIFLKNINFLSRIAQKKNVKLLIENNVIHKNEFNKFSKNTVLMSEPKEMVYIMKNTDKNVHLLLDVAHLKISSSTLKFNLISAIKKLNKWVKGYHLSENNGKIDNNKNLKYNSWFWPYIKKGLNYYSLEIYNNNIDKIKNQIALANNKIKK
jgi:sugar phosphate isomerase/epimerase